ncbi:hypothetical protein ACT3TB_09430 [Micrococcaceae sp. AOP34-BR2-30]
MALLIGAVVAAQPQPTTAAFTDDAYAQATVNAGELAAPTITSCTTRHALIGLVFQSVTITWTSPYPQEHVRLSATINGTAYPIAAGQINVSGPVNGLYTYSATLSSALLESIIGNLLGSTTTLTVSNVYPDHWVSQTRSRQLDIALLGLTSSCT